MAVFFGIAIPLPIVFPLLVNLSLFTFGTPIALKVQGYLEKANEKELMRKVGTNDVVKVCR